LIREAARKICALQRYDEGAKIFERSNIDIRYAAGDVTLFDIECCRRMTRRYADYRLMTSKYAAAGTLKTS